MSYFNFENKKIYYHESGKGTPLLLLHGNTASSNMFEEIVSHYEADYRVILIDFLGHGKSDRISKFPTDLWFCQAQQVIAFLREKQYEKVHLIGSSGGALVAINVALESPELVGKVIADSFEGETPLEMVYQGIEAERESSKKEEGTRAFYEFMHGTDWEQVVDCDTEAIARHGQEVGKFFHKELASLQSEILLTGSREDEFVSALSPNYFEAVYGEMLAKIGHGQIHLFETGGHPAMLSNGERFYNISKNFLRIRS